MKFSQGIIKNVNKKILVGALSLTLITTGLAGCDPGLNLKYKKNEQGEMVCVENIKHKYILDHKVVVFELNGEQEIYIAEVIEHTARKRYTEYYNVFGNQLIYTTLNTDSDLKVIYEEDLVSYLILYDKVKEEYSEQDLKELLEQIREDYEKENNKQLVKGK